MTRTVLVCSSVENARIVSAEPLSYDERAFDEIREIVAGDPLLHQVLDKMFNSKEAEIEGKELTRAIRELVSILRQDVSEETRKTVRSFIDHAADGIDHTEAVCIWTESGDPNVPYPMSK